MKTGNSETQNITSTKQNMLASNKIQIQVLKVGSNQKANFKKRMKSQLRMLESHKIELKFRKSKKI